MENELARSPLVVESCHLIGDTFHFPLAKPFTGRHAVESRDTAVGTVFIAAAAAHQVAGRHAGDGVNRTAPVGTRQYIQVIQHRTGPGETHLLPAPEGDAGNLGQALLQMRHGVGDLNQRPFPFVNHDDVDFRMVGEQRLGGAGSVVATRYDQLIGIARLDCCARARNSLALA